MNGNISYEWEYTICMGIYHMNGYPPRSDIPPGSGNSIFAAAQGEASRNMMESHWPMVRQIGAGVLSRLNLNYEFLLANRG